MGILDEVMSLKEKGFSDQQIINKLQEEGITPQEINDALNRARIKNAVSPKQTMDLEPSIMAPESPEPESDEEIILPPRPSSQMIKKDNYYPTTQEVQQQYGYEDSYSPMPPYSETYAPSENQNAGYGYATTDTDTMIEIAEQVFAEKMKSLLKKIEESLEFKTLADTKIENISARLKRIEFQIDSLQSAILEKVGSYGRGLEIVKKEIGMIEDSFGKVMTGLKAHTSHSKTSIKKIKASSKKKSKK